MDKSARVRGFAAGRCCGLALNELLPSIAISRATEKAQTTKFELDLAFHLMRDNFYEYEDCNGYDIVLNFPEEYPARHVWPGQVTKDMVLSEGVEAVRSRIRAENVSLGILVGPGTGMPKSAKDARCRARSPHHLACRSALGGSTKMSEFVRPSAAAFTMCQHL